MHKDYSWLIPQCIDLYYEHIYPIMPLLYMPTVRDMMQRQRTPPEDNLVFALCALTCLHMSGESIRAKGPDSWETAGRFFLDECISVRKSYDFLEDQSLYAIISSFWLSTSFFEIQQSRKSWMYLREAISGALDLRLDDDSTYAGLSPQEQLCRLRVFWILFVTERSFAILRNKPIAIKKTPSLPTTRHPYEAADIQSGFRQLISSYLPLDEAFVAAWNDSSDSRVTKTTYLRLQDLLSAPPAFVTRSRATTPSSDGTSRSILDIIAPSSTNVPISVFHASHHPIHPKPDPDDEPSRFYFAPHEATEDADPDPTDIQQADLLITQQWLRLIIWRSSEKRRFLSWSPEQESMGVAFPLEIARETAFILSSLRSTAVEVHGMGIFEKIFKIAMAYVDALSSCDRAGSVPGGGRGPAASAFSGMDFASGDLGVLGGGRRGIAVDPLEFFVKTLRSTPNSEKEFAQQLVKHAGQKPGGMRLSLSPPMPMNGFTGGAPFQIPAMSHQTWGGAAGGQMTGAVLGEVDDDDDVADPARDRVKRSKTSVMPASTPTLSFPYPSHNNNYGDYPLLSPGMSDPGFGGAVPGLSSASTWQPMMPTEMPTAMTQDWTGAGTSTSAPMDAFSYGQTLTSEELAYATFAAEGNANQMMGTNQSTPSGLAAHAGMASYGQYPHQSSAPGTGTTTPIRGDVAGGFGTSHPSSDSLSSAGLAYGQYQSHQSSAPGTGTSTPVGDGAGGFVFGGMQDDGQGRKRAWDSNRWA